MHAYYRTCDVSDQRCSNDGSGISHFVVGTAGHVLSNIEDEQKQWCESIVVSRACAL